MTSAVRFKEPVASTSTLKHTSPSIAAKSALSLGLQALDDTLRDNEVVTGVATKILQLLFTLKSKAKSFKKL